MSQGSLSKKDLLLVSEGNSNITDKIKKFLPKIAKANEELELADEETKKNLIMEKCLKELTDDESDEDEAEESRDENEQDLEEEESHVAITFTAFKDDEEEKPEDKQDFVIRRSEGEPANKKSKVEDD